jgi:hypothetical protein
MRIDFPLCCGKSSIPLAFEMQGFLCPAGLWNQSAIPHEKRSLAVEEVAEVYEDIRKPVKNKKGA